jgi:tetratricopeptide (TPR) repeat protein
MKPEGRKQKAKVGAWRVLRPISAFCFLLSAFSVLVAQEAPQPQPAPPSAPPAAAAATPQTTTNDEFAKAVFFGKKYFEMKDYAAAYQQFAKADALQPDQAGVIYNMAVLLARSGRFSEAQGKVDRYLQLFPAGAEKPLVTKLQFELEFQRELQRKRQANQEYGELFTRGRFLYTKNDLDAALKQFQDAEQKRPNDPAAVYNEAAIFEKMGDFAHAAERYHRYEELESDSDSKPAVDQHLLMLESEIDDMKTKLVCSFCGLRIPIGATWCPRCWHGPYLTNAAVWSSRPCVDGASATRATYYADDRFAKNDSLPCLWNGTLMEALRYTPAKQKQIEEARKAEGWTYAGDIIQGWSDKAGNQIRYVQGENYCEKVISPSGGEILSFNAHKSDAGWLLDHEDVVIDGQKYSSHYTYDAQNRIAQQQVDYQNASACDHVISMVADFMYANDALTNVRIKGGYEGYVAEGSPKTDWTVAIAYTYDAAQRVAKEELAVTSFTKMYTKKPIGAERDEVSRLYPAMRVNRPIENVARSGDLCGTAGSLLLGNAIDLRPFYAISPNLAVQLPFGVTKAVVSFTYPDSYKLR